MMMEVILLKSHRNPDILKRVLNETWQDISNKIVAFKENGFAFETDANWFSSRFAHDSKANFHASIKYDKSTSISWGIEDVNNVKAQSGNDSVSYPNIMNNIDLQYVSLADGLKENLILKDSNVSNIFTFNLTTNKLTPTLGEDGSILLKGENNEIKGTIEVPYMVDSNQAFRPDVSMTLESTQNPNTYRLTVTASKEWLTSSNRAYPVRITGQWDSTTLDWAHEPTVDESNDLTEVAMTNVAGNKIAYVNFNLWLQVKSWVNGNQPNYSFRMRHNKKKILYFSIIQVITQPILHFCQLPILRIQ